ncbi:hypothetical protein AB0C74_33195 [Spirillospora sp. NPDC048832]|jgi:hypothetical protein
MSTRILGLLTTTAAASVALTAGIAAAAAAAAPPPAPEPVAPAVAQPHAPDRPTAPDAPSAPDRPSAAEAPSQAAPPEAESEPSAKDTSDAADAASGKVLKECADADCEVKVRDGQVIKFDKKFNMAPVRIGIVRDQISFTSRGKGTTMVSTMNASRSHSSVGYNGITFSPRMNRDGSITLRVSHN